MEEDEEDREITDEDSDDDAHSISTVMPHELERVEPHMGHRLWVDMFCGVIVDEVIIYKYTLEKKDKTCTYTCHVNININPDVLCMR